MVDSILVVTDMFGKMVHVIPLSSSATAADVAQIYHENIYKHHGMQRVIVSDRDPKFTAGFWKALHEKVGTKLAMSTAAHPETDGASERSNRTVITALRILVEDNPDDWARRCSDVEFAINSSTARATGLSPFEVTYGYLPTPWPVDTWGTTDVPAADGFAESTRMNWLAASDAIIGARMDMAQQANKHRLPDSPQFEVGNKVYVSTKDLLFPPSLSRKFIPRFIGPYPIVAAVPSTSNYDVQLPPHLKVHPRFHASKLRPFFPNDPERFPARHFATPPSPSDLQDAAAPLDIIEKIIMDRPGLGRSGHKFLVRFLGMSSSEDRFYSEAALAARVPELLAAYIARKGGVLARKGHLQRGGK
jgi:hypothetical protein